MRIIDQVPMTAPLRFAVRLYAGGDARKADAVALFVSMERGELSNRAIAGEVGVSEKQVRRWREAWDRDVLAATDAERALGVSYAEMVGVPSVRVMEER